MLTASELWNFMCDEICFDRTIKLKLIIPKGVTEDASESSSDETLSSSSFKLRFKTGSQSLAYHYPHESKSTQVIRSLKYATKNPAIAAPQSPVPPLPEDQHHQRILRFRDQIFGDLARNLHFYLRPLRHTKTHEYTSALLKTLICLKHYQATKKQKMASADSEESDSNNKQQLIFRSIKQCILQKSAKATVDRETSHQSALSVQLSPFQPTTATEILEGLCQVDFEGDESDVIGVIREYAEKHWLELERAQLAKRFERAYQNIMVTKAIGPIRFQPLGIQHQKKQPLGRSHDSKSDDWVRKDEIMRIYTEAFSLGSKSPDSVELPQIHIKVEESSQTMLCVSLSQKQAKVQSKASEPKKLKKLTIATYPTVEKLKRVRQSHGKQKQTFEQRAFEYLATLKKITSSYKNKLKYDRIVIFDGEKSMKMGDLSDNSAVTDQRFPTKRSFEYKNINNLIFKGLKTELLPGSVLRGKQLIEYEKTKNSQEKFRSYELDLIQTVKFHFDNHKLREKQSTTLQEQGQVSSIFEVYKSTVKEQLQFCRQHYVETEVKELYGYLSLMNFHNKLQYLSIKAQNTQTSQSIKDKPLSLNNALQTKFYHEAMPCLDQFLSRFDDSVFLKKLNKKGRSRNAEDNQSKPLQNLLLVPESFFLKLPQHLLKCLQLRELKAKQPKDRRKHQCQKDNILKAIFCQKQAESSDRQPDLDLNKDQKILRDKFYQYLL